MSKITFTFKDPDYSTSCQNESEVSKAKKILEKFVEEDEYVFLQVDTEKKTVELLKIS